MRRFGFVQSTAGALLLVTSIYAITAACADNLTAPCAQDLSKLEDRGLMDGTWNLVTIDNTSAQNYPLPFPSLDVLVSSRIQFQSTVVSGDDCNAPTTSSGHAVAFYTIQKYQGPQKVKSYMGRFFYDHKTNQLRLSAAGYDVLGTVNGPQLVLTASHALIGGDRRLTLILVDR
jgi:hypothetical protein